MCMFIVMHYIFNPRHSNHLDLQQNYKILMVNLNLGLKRGTYLIANRLAFRQG